ERALRLSPVPTGPAEGLVTRTVAALSATAECPGPFWQRPRPRFLIRAAVLLIALAGLACWAGLGGPGTPLAFAEVAEKLHNAHTLAYQITVTGPEIQEPVSGQVFLKEPGQMRMELPGGGVLISRENKGNIKMLTLEPKGKTATVLESKMERKALKSPGKFDPMEFVERLRNLVNKDAKAVGTRQIGDVRAKGFQVIDDGQDWLVWADPETKLPVEIEFDFPANIHIRMRDFRFNPKLDDALFSLEVPAGYKLDATELEDLTPEQALVQTLRGYAELSD